MTRDEIIRMAREAGIEVHPRKEVARIGIDAIMGDDSTPKLERFAALVAAAEREACLKACKELLAVSERSAKDGDHFEIGRENAHTECIEAISARSQP